MKTNKTKKNKVALVVAILGIVVLLVSGSFVSAFYPVAVKEVERDSSGLKRPSLSDGSFVERDSSGLKRPSLSDGSFVKPEKISKKSNFAANSKISEQRKGDINHDGRVDWRDLRLLVAFYGKSAEDFGKWFWNMYARYADFNDDKKIDQSDLGEMLRILGRNAKDLG